MTPARRKVRRCWSRNQGISCTRPTESGCAAPGIWPSANRVATCSAVMLAKPTRLSASPMAVSISTRGSSQYAPRDPLRTTSMSSPKASMADATASAPTDRAAVSFGTNTRTRGCPALAGVAWSTSATGRASSRASSRAARTASLTNVVNRSPVTLPYTASPTRTDGPNAQFPRQYTASSCTRPSGVVLPSVVCSDDSAWRASSRHPTA